MNAFQSTLTIALGSLLLCALPTVRAQSLLTQWTFTGLSTAGVNASPTTSSGTGTASTLGMNFSGGSDNSGIASLAGTDTSPSNTGSSNATWKIRGTGGSGGNTNGWSSVAAIGTQGAQFAVNTTGYTAISASFDWFPSTKGEANLLAEYTANGTTWNFVPLADITIPTGPNLSVLTNTTSSNTVLNQAYLKTTLGNTWYNQITLNLAGLGVDNDANFAFQLINASTGADAVQATGGTALDNTAGNWSFDNVTIVGTPIPEPGTYALMLGLAVLPVAALRRRARRTASSV